jgi:hypothetical protein
MGKATIQAYLGESRYRILYTPDITYAQQRITVLDARILELDAIWDASQSGLAEAEADYTAITEDLDAALVAWAACAQQKPPCPSHEDLMNAVLVAKKRESEAGQDILKRKSVIAQNRAQRFSATQEISYLATTAKVDGVTMDVSCIDYDRESIDVESPIPDNTVVGTIETYGAKQGYSGGWLPASHVNIKSSSGPEYTADDHCIRAISSQPTATMFWNWCQWLYVMSRNPPHAVGTVLPKVSMAQQYLDLALHGDTPSSGRPGGYPFDYTGSKTLTNVPVNYLSCGARVFMPGDRAIIRFSGLGMASPVVIGFATQPRFCSLGIAIFGFAFKFNGYYAVATNLVSKTGVVASDVAIAEARYRFGVGASSFGGDRAIFAYGIGHNETVIDVEGLSITSLVSNRGVIAGDTAGAGTPRGHAAGSGFGGDKGIFAFGELKHPEGFGPAAMTNIVSNTGVVAGDTGGVGTIRQNPLAATYGYDKAIFGGGMDYTIGPGGTYYSMVNLVSNTGVMASDTSGLGLIRAYGAGATFGYDKAIFGFGETQHIPPNDITRISHTNIISNTGVVASDTLHAEEGRMYVAGAGYGGDKAIFGFGRAGDPYDSVPTRRINLVSNTGVLASQTSTAYTIKAKELASGASLGTS